MCKKKSKNIPQNHYNSKYDNAINFNQGIITSTIRRIMKRCQPGSRDNAGKKKNSWNRREQEVVIPYTEMGVHGTVTTRCIIQIAFCIGAYLRVFHF